MPPLFCEYVNIHIFHIFVNILQFVSYFLKRSLPISLAFGFSCGAMQDHAITLQHLAKVAGASRFWPVGVFGIIMTFEPAVLRIQAAGIVALWHFDILSSLIKYMRICFSTSIIFTKFIYGPHLFRLAWVCYNCNYHAMFWSVRRNYK